MSEAQFLHLPADGRKYELVDGGIITVPTESEHGYIVVTLTLLLGYLARNFGAMFDSNTGFRMASGNIRVPDLSFVSNDRLPGGALPKGFFPGAPDLCVEVISESESRREMARKVDEYFDSGARQLWHVFPAERRVIVFHSSAESHAYNEEDTLTAGDLIPGFQCRVAEIFARGPIQR
jgi:Uma2 family endonuclease